MFSHRIQWALEPNRIAEAIGRHGRERLADLTESNPTAAGIEYPQEVVRSALADARALTYQPTAFGLLTAREAVAGYYGGRTDPSCILLTASTSEAYSYLFKLLCDAGDEVLVPRPSYPLFEFLADLDGVRVVQYPMHYDHGWFIDTHELARTVSSRTRAIIFVNPNNPTGSFLKEAEYSAIAALCEKHQLALIIDEVFADYAFSDDAARVHTVAGRDDVLTFALSGLSKIAGLPQMKLGWIATGGPDRLRSDALTRLELIADTYLSVSAPVQHAAPTLLALRRGVQDQIRGRCRRNLHVLETRLQASHARILKVEAGWYATLQVPRTRSEEEWIFELLEHGVLVQPGFFFDFESEAYLVISLLTEPVVFDRGSAALAEALL